MHVISDAADPERMRIVPAQAPSEVFEDAWADCRRE
jgi:hypothetical protein